METTVLSSGCGSEMRRISRLLLECEGINPIPSEGKPDRPGTLEFVDKGGRVDFGRVTKTEQG